MLSLRYFQPNKVSNVLSDSGMAAEALEGVMSRFEVEGDLAYLDWRGEVIPF